MSVEPGADVLGFAAEYDEPDEQKPLPRHARPRAYVRRIIALLTTGLLLAVGLSTYLWLKLDSERDGRALMVATNEAFESSLDSTRQRLAETQESLTAANDKLTSNESNVTKLQQQLDSTEKEVADLKKELKAAESDANTSQAEFNDLEAAIQHSIELLNSCASGTAQVAASLEGGRYDREAVAQQARQAAGLCAAATASLASR